MINNLSELILLIKQYRDLQTSAKELVRVTSTDPNSFDIAYEAARASKHFSPNQKRSEIKYVYELIHQHQFKHICEIGTYRGGTLFMFCQAAAYDAKIVTVDVNSTFTRRQALRLFPRPGQKLRIVVGDSGSAKVERLVQAQFRRTGIDFLFIDGDHSFHGVFNDFVRYFPLVKPGGIIAFHDIHPDWSIRSGIQSGYNVGDVPIFWETVRKYGFHTEEIIENTNQDGYGIGIIYKEAN